ncbi:MAG: alpha-glucan family phosphorylase [Elusimicrobiota bacterium]|jgi:starch phosphorylase|nr:alpha-glucan family phosphorylase [Elusimicrobiota bacterium]
MSRDLFNEQQENFVLENFKSFVTVPNPPKVLEPLLEIARNMWWCWNSNAVELFHRIGRDLWEKSNHNPIEMLGIIGQDRFNKLANDDSFVSSMQRVHSELIRYMKMKTWYQSFHSKLKNISIAYFSMEFAVHESVPIYSGGLGVLSGDHLKSASDLGLPFVAVGLLYRYGYFKQFLNSEGLQQEEYSQNHFTRLPLERVKNEDGNTLIVEVKLPNNQTARIRAWKLQIGRIALYLLDADFDENPQVIRSITGELYGGNRDMRIRQEIILGIGGVRLLKALNIEPSVIHINEGHSAFLLYERLRYFIEDKGLSILEAYQMVKSSCVFTTHTPVPAGNEKFDASLVSYYLDAQYQNIGINKDTLLQWGTFPLKWGEHQTDFSMTILALQFANKANGVSRLHSTIARDMWSPLYPKLPKKEVPITHITNGIHTNTWISYEFASLFDRYLGSAWKDEPANHGIWNSIDSIPDTELWRAHGRRKERLVSYTRQKLKQQLIRRGVSPRVLTYADEVLDPDALTIGFARRFATYKRGNLIFRDLKRFKSIMTDKSRPVQMIIAGKAHPQDSYGKKIIQDIVNLANDEELKHKIIFLEDYDMNTAHYLVQGVDIWLNNPLRPQEASGTSGMKAAINGVLNLSILDGWWCEGYNGDNGWVIGSIDDHSLDSQYQDDIDSRSIYETIEREIVPLYFEKSGDGLPRGWIRKMKTSMQSLIPIFNTNRMVEEYAKKFYIPSSLKFNEMSENNFEAAKKKTQWQKNIDDNWNSIKILSSSDNMTHEMTAGYKAIIKAKIYLGGVLKENVAVQVYSGKMDSKKVLSESVIKEMKFVSQEGDDLIYEIDSDLEQVGHCAYAIRILPKYEDEIQYMPNRIIWGL